MLYDAGEPFPAGGSKLLRSDPSDAVTLIGAGVTLHECLLAADQLALDGTRARVIDLYSIKPIDSETLIAAADATEGRIVVAEDHHPEGGLGSAVASALLAAGVERLRLAHLSVSELPGSGQPRIVESRRHRRRAHRVGRRRVGRTERAGPASRPAGSPMTEGIFNPTAVPARHHVVVVGGGFGGIEAVKRLARAPLDVTLVDRRNFHLFQPLTYQVATGALSQGEVAFSLRALFRRAKNVRVMLAEVAGFDLEAREVRLDSAAGAHTPARSATTRSSSPGARPTPTSGMTNGAASPRR